MGNPQYIAQSNSQAMYLYTLSITGHSTKYVIFGNIYLVMTNNFNFGFFLQNVSRLC